MAGQKDRLVSYDPEGVFLPDHGIDPEDISALHSQLEAARSEVLRDQELWEQQGDIPEQKQPLDAGFFRLPERTLDAYREQRDQSELGRILRTAGSLREIVDRVVVLGIGGSYMGTRAIFEACCHPYHNELSRSERGSCPRLYFEGNNVDNDATQGLLDLLTAKEKTSGPENRWAMVVVSKSGGTLETAVAFRQFLRTLQNSSDAENLGPERLVIPITGAEGKLRDLSRALEFQEVFDIPDGVGGRFSVLTAVGLLPAAILGLDVVRLLEGARAMNEHFVAASPEENVVLRYVAVSHLLETKHGMNQRVLSCWSKALEAFGLWYDQLLAESLGKQEQGATPLTTVNTRDLHSRGQQHQQGRRDKVITNLIVDEVRCDPIPIGTSQHNQDGLNGLAEKGLPDIMDAAIRGTNRAYLEDQRPTADLHLPRLNEHTLGQMFQMMMLATVMEGRLIGINPYGQPGVEAYKKHMQAILRGEE